MSSFHKKSIGLAFPLKGRTSRLQDAKNAELPQEFFYGSLNYLENFGNLSFIDSRSKPKNPVLQATLKPEYFYRRYKNFPISLSRVEGLRSDLIKHNMVISFTDFFSLGIGLANQRKSFGNFTCGGFHSLSDIFHNQKKSNQDYIRQQVNKAIRGLDRLFFLGEADKQEAIKLFDIEEERTVHFKFGIDTNFWTPSEEGVKDENFVLAVGSDHNRDYSTLITACDHPLTILTKINLKKFTERENLTVLSGSLHEPKISDTDLRRLYQKAKCVVVPTKNVWQPSGQSVSMQAMACGKPVILSDIKGLWDRDVFQTGENCVLVEPGNPQALANAINQLEDDINLRRKIGYNARMTCKKYFNLDRMNASFNTIATI